MLTIVYCKRKDRGSFLHHTSARPRSLIKSIPYNHTTKSFTWKKNFTELQSFLRIRSVKKIIYKSRFQRKISRYIISTIIKNWERRVTITKVETKRVLFVITYNKNSLNVKQIINKHWNLLQISSNIRTAFEQEPIIGYRRNKNLSDLIGRK